MRVIGRLRLDQYDSRYAEAFRSAAVEPPSWRLSEFLASGSKLPGLGFSHCSSDEGREYHRLSIDK